MATLVSDRVLVRVFAFMAHQSKIGKKSCLSLLMAARVRVSSMHSSKKLIIAPISVQIGGKGTLPRQFYA